MVLRQGAVVALAGVALGLAGAALLGGLLEGFLYQVTSRDPSTYALVAGSVALVAAVAMLVPARRASRIDPMTALRVE
jgi:ABC-type antimicrobial peptide transport system permease subunit